MLPCCERVLLALLIVVSGGIARAGETTSTAPASSDELRTWKDSTGKFSTEAEMVRFENNVVHLRKADGTMVEVPLRRLSQEDQRWLRRELGRRREASKERPAGRSRNTPRSDDWPGWRGPNRDGKSPDRGLLTQWPPEGPPQVWKAENIGGGFSSVAVCNGLVYITGDIGGRLVLSAFDADGQLKWKSDIDAAWTSSHPGARSSPTIDGENLYLVSGNGLVGCYDARSGSRKWIHSMRQEFGGSVPNWGYAESVLIYENLAIVTPGGERCMVALDKTTGRPIWTTQGIRAGAHYSSCLAFQYQGVPVVVNGTAEGIVGVEARSGRLLWSHPFSARNTANCPTPAFADGHVFWANGYGKGGICFQLQVNRGRLTAEQAWTTSDMDCQHGGYVIHEGHIYGNNKNQWVCLELNSGRKKWETRGVGKGSVCFADGMLYLFGEDGGQAGLASCSPERLEMRGTFSVQGNGPSWAHPVVIGGRLYLRYDTNLYCFNVRAN